MGMAYLIKNGIVINAIVVDDFKAFESAATDTFRATYDEGVEVDDDHPAGIGWSYADGVFTPPPDGDGPPRPAEHRAGLRPKRRPAADATAAPPPPLPVHDGRRPTK